MTSIGPHLFWVTSRAAGISAMVLASVSVGLGLSMAARVGGGRLSDRKTLHEALSIGVMISVIVHALSLIGDSFMRPSLVDVTVPLVSDYKTLWMSVGIVSGWSLILFGLGYYARRRIGLNRWKVVHRFTLLAWAGGLIHALNMGTDAGQTWFLVLLGLSAAPPLALLGIRILERRPRPVTAPVPEPAR